jgi:hypothetical protein
MSEPPCIQSPELTDKNGGFDITEEDAAMLVKAFDRLDASIDAYKEHFGMNDITEKSGIDILKLLKKLDYRLGYIANNNVGYNPMSITDMADYLGISTLTCKRFIKESVELGIITKQLEKVVSQKRNVFRFNPKYTLGILG